VTEGADQSTSSRPRPVHARVKTSITAVFAALIAVATILSIPFPPPLGEITWSPPIYFSLAVLLDPVTAFSATVIGSFVGETYNATTRGFPLVYIAGIVWARGPEVFIIAWARKKSLSLQVTMMFVATVYETVAFLIPDWLFYTYGLFGYGTPMSISAGFVTAAPDVFTMVDALFIPIAVVVIKVSGPAFRRLGFR
jgi:uncharacterized membrane protein